MNCVPVPYVRTSEENSAPAAVGGGGETVGEKAAAAGEEGNKAEARGEEGSQNVVGVEEGEKMGGVYIQLYIQSVACRVLHAVESSAICFLQIIQQLQDKLTALCREWEERKAAEAAEEEKRAAVAAKRRE